MRKLVIEIEVDHEGTQYVYNQALLLRDIASQIEDGHTSNFIRDVNGNIVGSWAYISEN